MREYGNPADALPWVKTFERIPDIQIAISYKIGDSCLRRAAGGNNTEAVTGVQMAKPQCLQSLGGTCSWRTEEPHGSMDGTSPLWCTGREQGNGEPAHGGRFPWETSTERPTEEEEACTSRSARAMILACSRKCITESTQLWHVGLKWKKKKTQQHKLATFCASTFINLATRAHSRPCSPSVGADGGATRGPGDHTGWMAQVVTLRRDPFFSISRLAPLVQPVQHIYLR